MTKGKVAHVALVTVVSTMLVWTGATAGTAGPAERTGQTTGPAALALRRGAVTATEVAAEMTWVQMLTRRATRAARNRWERDCAGHARDELRKAKNWLDRGVEQERARGSRAPHRRPISIARRIERPRAETTPRHVSQYQKALHHVRRGARYALAALKSRGLDPDRESDEEAKLGKSQQGRPAGSDQGTVEEAGEAPGSPQPAAGPEAGTDDRSSVAPEESSPQPEASPDATTPPAEDPAPAQQAGSEGTESR
ncbi:MAG: hypothetical protein HY815_31940 [Candidatus Riflebacteria bacterium]|nr:hypothetical protein [Candidatus Riflebacteria bacterium]